MADRGNWEALGETEDRFEAQTPFMEVQSYTVLEAEEFRAETSTRGEAYEFETPFLAREAFEGGETEALAPEALELSETLAELRDSEFREALEQLAAETLEANETQLEGEYGDRETRDISSERLLTEHLLPLGVQMEQMLDRFFERLEGQETAALTAAEIDRFAAEAMPAGTAVLAPSHEQFLGGILRKAARLAKGALKVVGSGIAGAARLAGQGLAAIGKLALGPLLQGLKRLGKALLRHVVRYALNRLPVRVQPLARKLSARLFQAIGETSETVGEAEDHEQSEGIPTGPSVARLEAEFDIAAAQLLLTADEQEAEHLVGAYSEAEQQEQPLAQLDAARAQLIEGLGRLRPGESPKPVMEQFLPAVLLALRPVARGAVSLIGRPKIVGFIGDLIGKLVRPIIGGEFAPLLGSAIADAGMTLLGLETSEVEPRRVGSEALAATIEETLTSIAELPVHELENEALLELAVREAFETAAASYFPTGVIRPELRETTGDPAGMWVRMPAASKRKRYAKYTRTFPVTITPQVASRIRIFGNATLRDYFRDRLGLPRGAVVKGKVHLYKALYGTRGSTIARAERCHSVDILPLTPEAAGALLGPNAALGFQPASDVYLGSPQVLQIRQRLYRIELPTPRRPSVPTGSPAIQLLVNLRTEEIKLWLYLPEALCQQISTELGKGRNHLAAFMLIRPLVAQAVETVKTGFRTRRMPHNVRLISETPELEGEVPAWLVAVAEQIGKKLWEWLSQLVIEYLQNRADQFRQTCASRRDGVTLRVSLSRVPGMGNLRLLSQGKALLGLLRPGWMSGVPGVEIVTLPGRSMQ